MQLALILQLSCFKYFAFFKYTMPCRKSGNSFKDWRSSCSDWEVIKVICLAKKLFWLEKKNAWQKAISNSYWDNCFFIINSNIQELICPIHCLWYIFCHQNKTMKFCWFPKFLFYGLYIEFFLLSVL